MTQKQHYQCLGGIFERLGAIFGAPSGSEAAPGRHIRTPGLHFWAPSGSETSLDGIFERPMALKQRLGGVFERQWPPV